MRDAASRRNYLEFITNLLGFHHLLWRTSGRKGIERALRAITTPTATSVFTIKIITDADFDFEPNLRDHEELLTVLKAGSHIEIRRVYTEKMTAFRSRYFESLRKLQDREAISEPEPTDHEPLMRNASVT